MEMAQRNAIPAGYAGTARQSRRSGLFVGHGVALREGLRDGVPIALGYLAVSFSLGIAARAVGLNAVEGFFASLFNNASAGEFAGFAVIGAGGSLVEMAVVMLIANARYLLMSCSMSQRMSPDTPLVHRILVGFDLTDELFGIAIARPGTVDPYYSYGAMIVALPGWALGGMFGVIAGDVLPVRVVSALSVALFGMFIAIIVPPARKNHVIAAFVLASFAASWAFGWLPAVSAFSSGTRTIILTVGLSALAAVLFPVRDQKADADKNGAVGSDAIVESKAHGGLATSDESAGTAGRVAAEARGARNAA